MCPNTTDSFTNKNYVIHPTSPLLTLFSPSFSYGRSLEERLLVSGTFHFVLFVPQRFRPVKLSFLWKLGVLVCTCRGGLVSSGTSGETGRGDRSTPWSSSGRNSDYSTRNSTPTTTPSLTCNKLVNVIVTLNLRNVEDIEHRDCVLDPTGWDKS